MEKENKETIFEVITTFIVILTVYTENEYLLLASIVSISISLWFWYNNNIINPIQTLQYKTNELHKDLNTRKELEELRMKIAELHWNFRNQKKGSLNPFLFIILLAILAMIILYLKQKGLI